MKAAPEIKCPRLKEAAWPSDEIRAAWMKLPRRDGDIAIAKVDSGVVIAEISDGRIVWGDWWIIYENGVHGVDARELYDHRIRRLIGTWFQNQQDAARSLLEIRKVPTLNPADLGRT